MVGSFRKRSSFHFPITLSASLMALNVTLMICWIVVLARGSSWTALTIGVVLFVTSRIAEISFEAMSRAILPWLIPLLIVLALVTVWPPLTLWLPTLLMGP